MLFVEHSPTINSHNLKWLDVERADYTAQKDIEHCEYRVFKFVRPMVSRKSKDEKR